MNLGELFFSAPNTAGPQDQPMPPDEMGRKRFRTVRGDIYTVSEPEPFKAKLSNENLAGILGVPEYATDADGDGIANRRPNIGGAVKALLEGAWRGVEAPGKALRGEPVSYGDTWATALDWGVLGAPMPAPKGSLRMGALLDDGFNTYHGTPHTFPAERLVKMPDGTQQFIVGGVDQLPDIPAGAELVRDFPLGRPRLDKIGTGEGAQAYGHGFYSAEERRVGEQYREFLALRNDPLKDPPKLAASLVYRTPEATREAGIKQARALIRAIDDFPAGYKHDPGARERAVAALEFLESGEELPKMGGSLYELRIKANPDDFLDWDKPLSEQPQKVRDALSSGAIPPVKSMLGGMRGRSYMEPDVAPHFTGADLVRAWPTSEANNSSAALREAGIPGIRYLDGGSRGAANVNDLRGTVSMWEGAVRKSPTDDYARQMLAEAQDQLRQAEASLSRNYVLFDEMLVEILRRYGLAGLATAGTLGQTLGNDNGI